MAGKEGRPSGPGSLVSHPSSVPRLTVYLASAFKALLDKQFLSTIKDFEKHPAGACGRSD